MLKKVKNKKLLILLGLISVILGIALIFNKMYLNYLNSQNEYDSLNIFFDEQFNDDVNNEEIGKIEDIKADSTKSNFINYIAVLEIPKINLKRGLVDINSIENNVNKNIQILKESTMPNNENGNLILASHSGNSDVSFFKDLNYLEIGDVAYIYYNSKIYQYSVVNKYEIEKTGNLTLSNNKAGNKLILITCKDNTNKQIVVICELRIVN